MDKRLIIKLNRHDENRAFLSRIMHMLHQEDYDYNILNRPDKAYSVESFDGLLEIFPKANSDLMAGLDQLIGHTQASLKGLWLEGSDGVSMMVYDKGLKSTMACRPQDGHPGGLRDEALYWGQTFSIFYGESIMFLQSVDYIEALEIMIKYPFIKVDFNEYTAVAEECFILQEHEKRAFVEDLSKLNRIFRRYDMPLDCRLVGYDARLNVEQTWINKDAVEQCHFEMNL